jgi:hypothetical protein
MPAITKERIITIDDDLHHTITRALLDAIHAAERAKCSLTAKAYQDALREWLSAQFP